MDTDTGRCDNTGQRKPDSFEEDSDDQPGPVVEKVRRSLRKIFSPTLVLSMLSTAFRALLLSALRTPLTRLLAQLGFRTDWPPGNGEKLRSRFRRGDVTASRC